MVTATTVGRSWGSRLAAGDLAAFGFIQAMGGVLLFTLVQLLAVAGFMFRIPLGPWHFPLALGLTLVALVFLFAWRPSPAPGGQAFRPGAWVGIAGWLLVVGCCFTLSALVFDFSWDGRTYHAQAVLALAGGWNPLHDPAGDIPGEYDILLQHYAQGHWLAAAAVYQFTGHLNAAKTFSLVLAWGLFSLSLAALLHWFKFPPWQAAALAGLFTANPVITTQLFSLYNDGLVASLLGMALIAFLLVFLEGRRVTIPPGLLPGGKPRGTYLLLLLSSAASATVKFNGLGFLVILLAWLSLGIALKYRDLRSLAIPLSVAGAGVAFGVLLLGYQPYVTNTLAFGNPFYPLYGSPPEGKPAISILAGQIPPAFLEKSRFEQLAYSLFAPSQNLLSGELLPFKMPFSFSRSELEVFSGTDVRIGGFGPWFGGVLLLSLGMLWFLRRTFAGQALAWGITGILLCALVVEGGWWARYAPQVYWIPVLVLVGWVAALPSADHSRLPAVILSVVLAGNIFMTAGPGSLYAFSQSAKVHNLLAELREQGQEIAYVDRDFVSTRVILEEAGLPAVEYPSEEALPCPPERLMLLVSYSLLSCPPP